MSVRILITEDYQPMRLALRRFLEGNADMKIVGEAVDGREAVQQCLKLKPDVVTMDVRMSDVDGIQATRQISHLMPQVAIVAVSAEAELGCVYEMLAAGASGYVLKKFVCEELKAAIQAVAGGRAFLGQLVIDEVLVHAINDGSPSAQKETAMLRGLAQGKSPDQIASELCLASGVIRETLRSISHRAITPAIGCLLSQLEAK